MPQYGERWGRHWLDVVRYGEDNPGNITNPPYPHAWRYRDWVIEALNKDVPYDRFVKLQLAADLMPGTSRPDMRALGPIALGPQDHKDVRLSIDVVGTLQLNDWDERLDTVTPRPARVVGGVRALPRSQVRSDPADGLRAADERVRVDVARAASVLRDRSEDRNALHVGVPADVRPALHGEPARKRSRVEARAGRAAGEEVPRRSSAELQAEIDAMSKEYPQIAEYIKTVPYPGERPPEAAQPRRHAQEARAGARREARAPGRSDSESRARRRTQGGGGGPRKRIDPQAPFLNSVYDAGVWWNTSEPDLTFFDVTPGKPRDLPLYRGGNLGTPADPAPRGFPLVLAKDGGDFNNGSGRLELGEKIFTDAAPLSARVMVNRVWGWHFDKHLVGTPSDFGIQGLPPTHPELLEDLSARFIASGWSLKWLHREIMLSATYRQSSKPRAQRDGSRSDEPAAVAHEPAAHGHRGVSRLAAAGVGQARSRRCTGRPSRHRRRRSRRTVYASISRGRSTTT